MAMIIGDGTGPHITADERALLEWLKSFDMGEVFGFRTIIVENKHELPPVGIPTALYIVQNFSGSVGYVWEPENHHYRIIMQDPTTIKILRGGNANE